MAAGAQDLRLPAETLPLFPGAPGQAPGPFAIAAADLNYDYRTDLVLAGAGGVRIAAPGRGRTVRGRDRRRAASPPSLLAAPAFGVWAADVDTDGDLDVVLAPTSGAVARAPQQRRRHVRGAAAVRGRSPLRGFAWADLDGDGVPDAALLDASGAVHVFLNLRGGSFREETRSPRAPKRVAVAADASGDPPSTSSRSDADGVGDPAVARGPATLDRGQACGRVSEPPAGLAAGTARLLVADLDNNGAADLVVAGASGIARAAGERRGRVRSAAGRGRRWPRATRPTSTATAASSSSAWPRRRAARAIAAAAPRPIAGRRVRPRSATATGDQRINSFGIGGEVELRTGLHLQKPHRSRAPVVHFGLGEARAGGGGADRLAERRPPVRVQHRGGHDRRAPPSASRARARGSSPGTGARWRFVTDLIWRSPLGLRINAQTTADVLMTEDWVKVRGDQLGSRRTAPTTCGSPPSCGRRTSSTCSRCWSWTTRRARRCSWTSGSRSRRRSWRVLVTGPVRDARAARDDDRGATSPTVRPRARRPPSRLRRPRRLPGHHPRPLRRAGAAGGARRAAARCGWSAQGWVHPTDSSVNVAIGQGAHARPRGLSLHVADAAGRFRQVRDGLGFPSGKDKTVLLDLDGPLPAKGPRRLRLATNLEVFWDRLGWAVGRPDVRVEPRARRPRRSAELRYRGYSVTEQAAPPARPSARATCSPARRRAGWTSRATTRASATCASCWREVDDRYVIMNAGDEMRLRFPEVAAPPAGQVRDFVLVGDGWVKDGDFNTTFSRTVLPLPTHASGTLRPRAGRARGRPRLSGRTGATSRVPHALRLAGPARVRVRCAAARTTRARELKPSHEALRPRSSPSLFLALLATPLVMRRFGRACAGARGRRGAARAATASA